MADIKVTTNEQANTPQGVTNVTSNYKIIAVFQNANGDVLTAQIIDNEEYMRIFNTGEYIDFGTLSKDKSQVVVIFKKRN